MKRRLSTKTLIIGLLALSGIFYLLHYLIFRDAHHIAIFAMHDIAFLPIEVILVSLVFDRVLDETHRDEQRGKVNMIESIFFKESGSDMLCYLVQCDPGSAALCRALAISPDWGLRDFEAARRFLKGYAFSIDTNRVDFFALHYHLVNRHKYFLKVIENPALMDHESFTDLILSMYHLWEELDFRTDLYSLSAADKAELGAITESVYRQLASEWLLNISYTQKHHAARFANSLRNSPFSFAACAEKKAD